MHLLYNHHNPRLSTSDWSLSNLFTMKKTIDKTSKSHFEIKDTEEKEGNENKNYFLYFKNDIDVSNIHNFLLLIIASMIWS